jgi:hypothetical protein
MRIRMLEQRTGPRYDGRSWPGYGGEIDVPDDEARGLCEQGSAVPVPVPDAAVETREAKAAAPKGTAAKK